MGWYGKSVTSHIVRHADDSVDNKRRNVLANENQVQLKIIVTPQMLPPASRFSHTQTSISHTTPSTVTSTTHIKISAPPALPLNTPVIQREEQKGKSAAQEVQQSLALGQAKGLRQSDSGERKGSGDIIREEENRPLLTAFDPHTRAAAAVLHYYCCNKAV